MDKIVSKTPLRISFAGDGTDHPSFYQKHGGTVISTAIDKYVTVTVSPRRDAQICVSSPACPDGIGGYPDSIGTGAQLVNPDLSGTVTSVDQIHHPIVRESIRKTGVGLGINIDIASDVAPGSGLGCSSALTVGLLNALRAYYAAQQQIEPDSNPRYTTNPIYTWTLAREACEIEINRLGQPIGKQGPYIAAYGGFRRFTFESKGGVGMELIKPPDGLERVLMLFDIRRAGYESNQILPAQNQAASPKTLLKMKRQCGQLYSLLRIGNIEAIGCLLHEAWKLKKSLAPSICSDRLDTIYRIALDAGALGGKGLGTNGGDHFLLLAPLKTQKAIVKALDGLATRVPFKFESKGSRLI